MIDIDQTKWYASVQAIIPEIVRIDAKMRQYGDRLTCVEIETANPALLSPVERAEIMTPRGPIRIKARRRPTNAG